MEHVLKFMRSDTYKNFWKFSMTGLVVSGVLTVLAALVYNLTNSSGSDEGLMIYVFVAFWGAAFGFSCAVIGFVVMYFIGRNQSLSVFSKRSLLLAAILATAVSTPFILDSKITFWIIVFPGIPFLGSMYFFRYFAVRYIYPLVSSEKVN